MSSPTRNVFDKVQRSNIPIFDVDPLYVPYRERMPLEIENLTPHKNISEMISIDKVQINFQNPQIEVFISGVPGEVYTLRVSHGGVNVVLEEMIFIQYSSTQHPLRMALERGQEYGFTLFDNYNTPQDVYTIVSPVNFRSVASTRPTESALLENIIIETLEGKESVKLDATNDSSPVLWSSLLLIVVVFFLVVKRCRGVWSRG